MPFAHEKLQVYQRAIDFVAWTQPILDKLPPSLSAKNQLERASTSIPLNIAEGNGKFSYKDRSRFWQIAHGSAVECAACFDVLVARKAIKAEQIEKGKALLEEIVKMLLGLLKRYESRLVEEEATEYGTRISSSASSSPSASPPVFLEEDEEVEAEEEEDFR